MAPLAVAGGTIVLLTWLHWQSLQKVSRTTRWFFFSLLVLSGGLWVLVTTNLKMVRPAAMLLQLLEPFDPIE